MRRWGAVPTPVGHGPGDHLCWVHQDKAAWRGATVVYLHDGAQQGDRLLYVADAEEGALVDQLAELPARDAMLGSGQLRVVPLAEAIDHRQHGWNDRMVAASDGPPPATPSEALQRLAIAAVAAGYRSLRLAVDASPMIAAGEDGRRLAAFELRDDRTVADSPLSALCGYHEGRVGADLAQLLAAVHPLQHGTSRPPGCQLFAAGDGSWWLAGEADVATTDALAVALSTLPTDRDIHLRCGALGFIDVGSCRTLVQLAARLAPEHRLVLHEPPPGLRRILALAWPTAPGLEVANR